MVGDTSIKAVAKDDVTHKLILKVKKFQIFSAKSFGTVEEKPPGRVDCPPPPQYHLIGLNKSSYIMPNTGCAITTIQFFRQAVQSFSLGIKDTVYSNLQPCTLMIISIKRTFWRRKTIREVRKPFTFFRLCKLA